MSLSKLERSRAAKLGHVRRELAAAKEVLHLPKVGLLEKDIHKNYLEIKWDLGHTKLLIE